MNFFMPPNKVKINRIDDYYKLSDQILKERETKKELIFTEAVGLSMSPVIVSGDVIAIDSSLKDTLSEGDIIAFRKKDLFVCHRIVKLTERNGLKIFVTKGDNLEKNDEREVFFEEIAGKVVQLVRGRRRINPYQNISQNIRPEAVAKKLINGIKKWIKRNQIVSSFYYGLKKVIFIFIKRFIIYDFNLPLKQRKYPAYRYFSIPLKDIWSKSSDFYFPLDEIGGFKLEAGFFSFGKATVEVAKVKLDNNDNSFWIIERSFVRGIFFGVNWQRCLIKRCYIILNKIGKDELYLAYDDKVAGFLKGSDRFIEREAKFKHKGRALYLLKNE